jgi:AraC-like DNA-binding protein
VEFRKLWRTEVAEIVLSRWDRSRHSENREDSTEAAVIEFMRMGSYCRCSPRGETLVDPNQVAFFNPLETFRVTHPCGSCNSGLSIHLSPGLVDTMRGDFDRDAFAAGVRPFLKIAAMSSPQCHLLQTRLVSALADGYPMDPIATEELLLHLIHQALVAASGVSNLEKSERSNAVDRRNRDRVETIRRYLFDHWTEPVTLRSLARLANCSRWHIASLFRAGVGVPIYRYLKRLRLRQVLARLQDGCSDLTRLALECGFCSHSHLSMAFRQEFGATPSCVRSELSRQAPPCALLPISSVRGGHARFARD